METEKQILEFTVPESLFPGDLAEAKKKFHELALYWHPDKTTGDAKVMSHITELYKEAVRLLETGKWRGSSFLDLKKKGGGSIRFKYLVSRSFELGYVYIANTHISYLIDKKFEQFSKRAERTIKNLHYADDKMKKEMSKTLPESIKVFELEDDKLLLTIPKSKNLVPLREVFSYYKGKIEPVHVAWIGSGLHNIACYLEWAKIVHGDISLDSVFISPSDHSVSLLGSWWFAVPIDEKISTLPIRTYKYLPWEVKCNKIATPLVDLEIIRATVRELLGDITGRSLSSSPMVDLVQIPVDDTAQRAYKLWHEALQKTFGKRKFVKMELHVDEAYKQGE